MYEFIDAIELFIESANGLKIGQINLNSSLDEMVLKTSKAKLAYVDNRRDAKEKYNFDFWYNIKDRPNFMDQMNDQGINARILYSKSDQFPDFLFKVRTQNNNMICGSLLELKDSKSGSIASFNSTLPTKYKSLNEVNTINGNSLVSKIASIIDGEVALDENYYTFQRRNFYLIRTYKDNDSKVKISIVDGSFFETVPKEHLIYQMFLNILRDHLKKRDVEISKCLLDQIEKSLSYITDQTIIAASQTIENASVRPRLRIMAEVHNEGNPHSSVYPEISGRSLNLILQECDYEEKIEKMINEKVDEIGRFIIQHKRNGKHIVFQYKF